MFVRGLDYEGDFTPQQQAALIERQPHNQQRPMIYQNFQNYQQAPQPQQQVVYDRPYYPPAPSVVVRPQVVHPYPPPPPAYGYRHYGPGY